MPEYQDRPLPKFCYDRHGLLGRIVGRSAFGQHSLCQLGGCTGVRVSVRWPDGRLTRPCTKGMKLRPDGQWQIL